MSTQIKGVITIATICIGFTAFALMGWMGWVSVGVIDSKTNQAAIAQWQVIYGQRIDWLVQRNGANPEAITNNR